MVAMFAQKREILFGILPDEASFEQRGVIPSNPQSQARFIQLGHAFVPGYTTALDGLIPNVAVTRLTEIAPELQGFAYEAGVLAIVLLDGAHLGTTPPSQLMSENRRGNLKIYVSATYRDLQKHRFAVLNILRRMGHQPIGMEDYVAEGVRPISRCLDDVPVCDAYLCIVAWRYGFVPQDGVLPHLLPAGGELGKTSVTEFEYRKAIQAKKPILAFVLDEDAEWPSHFFDAVSAENENGGKVTKFRQELSQQYMISYFRSAEELASLVSAAVYRTEMARQMDLESLNIKAAFNDPFKRNGPVTDSTLFEISNVIAGPDNVQALQVNIGSGSDWWMTRLYFICSLATDLTSIEIVVFEAGISTQTEAQPRRFVGTIHPKIVKERLASQYEQLRRYENAVAESEPSSDLHAEVSRRANVWKNIVDPNGSEGRQPVFVTEANLERWLSPYLISQAVDIEAGGNAALRMQRVLDWPMRFVPITENGQFKQVVDKRALTKQVARLFIREQVSRALSTVR